MFCFSCFHTLIEKKRRSCLLTLQGNSISPDGSDGIIHVIIGLQSGVDIHHLKINWHTGEPAAQYS